MRRERTAQLSAMGLQLSGGRRARLSRGPSARAADAMARDISRDEEEAEVGAELLAVLTREQRRLRAGAPLPETATPLGAMAADFDGGPEDDECWAVFGAK